MNQKPKLTLTDLERNSGLWRKLQAHMQDRLASHLRHNGKLNTPEKKRDANCGAIAELQHLLGIEVETD